MNKQAAQLLEQHFDTAFAAPDGIAKLRELILTLAMQGKLVEQDPNDPPASELLKEIEAERKRGSHEGTKTRRKEKLPPIKPEEVPYELPHGWEWVRLIEIGSWALGSGLPHSIQGDTGQEILLCKVSDMNLPGNEKFIVTTNNTVSEKVVQQSKLNISDPGTIIFPKIGGAIATNKRRILQKKTVIDNNCLGITPASVMNLEWCYQLLLSFDFAKYQTGTSVPAISQGIIGEIVIGLPPLPEQHRIVARIDQLMARCDELERLRKEREEKRVAVHAAAVRQLLDAPDRSAQKAGGSAWEFIQQHFGELYTVKENVAELRKAILQLAVMGHLVPQDPNDPPASELLKEIEKEKASREGAKTRRKEKLPPIKPEEVPYELPQGWEWVRLGEAASLITKGATPTTYGFAFEPSGIPFVKVENVKDGSIQFTEKMQFISEEAHDYQKRSQLEEYDLLFSIAGTIGETCVVKKSDIPANINQALAIIRGYTWIFSPHFLINALDSAVSNAIKNRARGAAMNNISLGDIKDMIIPAPPVPEQHRIVARIDQLMVLCDTLDYQIEAATDKRTELLNALMANLSKEAAQPSQPRTS